jgi:hypothetical protein
MSLDLYVSWLKQHADPDVVHTLELIPDNALVHVHSHQSTGRRFENDVELNQIPSLRPYSELKRRAKRLGSIGSIPVRDPVDRISADKYASKPSNRLSQNFSRPSASTNLRDSSMKNKISRRSSSYDSLSTTSLQIHGKKSSSPKVNQRWEFHTVAPRLDFAPRPPERNQNLQETRPRMPRRSSDG